VDGFGCRVECLFICITLPPLLFQRRLILCAFSRFSCTLMFSRFWINTITRYLSYLSTKRTRSFYTTSRSIVVSSSRLRRAFRWRRELLRVPVVSRAPAAAFVVRSAVGTARHCALLALRRLERRSAPPYAPVCLHVVVQKLRKPWVVLQVLVALLVHVALHVELHINVEFLFGLSSTCP
jgi:hypothetical protein